MRYVVKDTHIRHGAALEARTYGPGDEIELTEDEASHLGVSVEPLEGTGKPVDVGEDDDGKKRRKGK